MLTPILICVKSAIKSQSANQPDDNLPQNGHDQGHLTLLPGGYTVLYFVVPLFDFVSETKFVSCWLKLQAVMSMFHDLGFVSRHHIIPDRLARYVPNCTIPYATCCSS